MTNATNPQSVVPETLVTFVRVKDAGGIEWYVNPAYVVAIEPLPDRVVVALSTGRELVVATDRGTSSDEARRLAAAMTTAARLPVAREGDTE